MMEYVKTLIGFLMLETILCQIISDHGMKRMVKLFCGLVLAVILLQPIGNLLGLEGSMETFIRKAQVSQEIEKYQSLLEGKDASLTEQYEVNYKAFVQTQSEEVVEQQGYQLKQCQVIQEAGELKQINLVVTQQEISGISVEVEIDSEESEPEQEEPQLIAIRNELICLFGISGESITIRKA